MDAAEDAADAVALALPAMFVLEDSVDLAVEDLQSVDGRADLPLLDSELPLEVTADLLAQEEDLTVDTVELPRAELPTEEDLQPGTRCPDSASVSTCSRF